MQAPECLLCEVEKLQDAVATYRVVFKIMHGVMGLSHIASELNDARKMVASELNRLKDREDKHACSHNRTVITENGTLQRKRGRIKGVSPARRADRDLAGGDPAGVVGDPEDGQGSGGDDSVGEE